MARFDEPLRRIYRQAGERVVAAVRLVAGATSLCLIACTVYTIVGRFSYPYDLEWMTGSVLDHVDRIRRGAPLYTPPTSDWIPFLYPPGYYWVSAMVAKMVSLRSACRGVSVVATLVQAACIVYLARRRGATRFWIVVGVGAFAGAFALSEYWYDIERADSLFVAMVLCGYALVELDAGIVVALGAGLLLGLAFFVKQPALLFIGAMGTSFVVAREWRRAFAFALGAALPLLSLGLSLEKSSGGWFSHYVLKMPSSHGLQLDLFPLLAGDLERAWLYTGATFAFLALALHPATRRTGDARLVLGIFAAFAASCSSRMHIGGWPNVLVFWTAFASIAMGVVGARLEDVLRRADVGAMASGGNAVYASMVAAQLVGLSFDPTSHIPTRAAEQMQAGFVSFVRTLERDGEVLEVDVGHLTSAEHYHQQALVDVLHTDKVVPASILDDLRRARFAYIIVNGFEDLWVPQEPGPGEVLFRAIASRYAIHRKLDERLPATIVAWPSRPTWVLRRREAALADEPMEPLLRQHLAEIAAANLRQEAERRGVRLSDEGSNNQAFGAAIVERLYLKAEAPPNP